MTEEWNNSVGERLLQLRNKKGMTQEDLAEYLNVSRQSVSKWELNKTLPDVEKLMLLSDLYEVTLDYLVKGVEETEEEDSEVSGDEMNAQTESDTEAPVEEDALTSALSMKSPFELTVHRIVFLIAMLVSGVLFVGSLLFSVRLMSNHIFSVEGKQQDIVYVDQVYEQYTLADVQILDENQNFIHKKVWLDVNGVREGDYIGYYYDEDEMSDVHFMYYAKTLIVPFIVVILSLIFTIVCWMGFRSYGSKKKERIGVK